MNEASDYSHYIRRNGDGSAMMDFAVEDITCAACITKIESALHHLPGVEQARINYTNRRLHVEWSFGRIDLGPGLDQVHLRKRFLTCLGLTP